MATKLTPSKRWTHFHSALQLAIQRASHKWTYDDFCSCFSIWCEEEPVGSKSVFSYVAQHMESRIQKDCDELFTQYSVKDSIDILHAVVTEARARAESGKIGRDVWKENLEPRASMRARTVPVLEEEKRRLQEVLDKMERDNLHLQDQLQQNMRQKEEADAKVNELLDILDDVYDKWSRLPWDEIETWTVQTVETSKPVQPA